MNSMCQMESISAKSRSYMAMNTLTASSSSTVEEVDKNMEAIKETNIKHFMFAARIRGLLEVTVLQAA